MPDYRESSITGTTWTRCNRVTITNMLAGEPPTAYFQEEKVVSVGGVNNTVFIGGSVTKAFNPTGTFPLLDPTTNAPIGPSMTHAELYVALYSLYMQTAVERDTLTPS